MARFGLMTASVLAVAITLLGCGGDAGIEPEPSVSAEEAPAPPRASAPLPDAWLDQGECVRVTTDEVEERQCGESDANAVVWKVARPQDGCEWHFISVQRDDDWFSCVSMDE